MKAVHFILQALSEKQQKKDDEKYFQNRSIFLTQPRIDRFRRDLKLKQLCDTCKGPHITIEKFNSQ